MQNRYRTHTASIVYPTGIHCLTTQFQCTAPLKSGTIARWTNRKTAKNLFYTFGRKRVSTYLCRPFTILGMWWSAGRLRNQVRFSRIYCIVNLSTSHKEEDAKEIGKWNVHFNLTAAGAKLFMAFVSAWKQQTDVPYYLHVAGKDVGNWVYQTRGNSNRVSNITSVVYGLWILGRLLNS